jgi:hypothetical protein
LFLFLDGCECGADELSWVGTENAYLRAWFAASSARKEEPQSEASPRESNFDRRPGFVD